MDRNIFEGSPSREAKAHFPLKDLACVLIAIVVIVVGNCSVVRALNIVLDAMHR